MSVLASSMADLPVEEPRTATRSTAPRSGATSAGTGRFAASYVTGSHTLKAGFTVLRYNLGRDGIYNDPDAIDGGRSYVFRNQVPIQVRLWAVPYEVLEHTTNSGIYAQDQWVVRKLTLNLGLRTTVCSEPYRHSICRRVTSCPRATSRQPTTCRITRTSIRASAGPTTSSATARPPSKRRSAASCPGWSLRSAIPQSGQPAFATVTWNDSFYGAGDPRTGNFVPDCDLRNLNGSGECGPWSDRGFGQVRAGTRFAKDATEGFNKRGTTGRRRSRCSTSCGRGSRSMSVISARGTATSSSPIMRPPLRRTTIRFASRCPQTIPRLPGGGQQRCGFFDIKPSPVWPGR